MPHNLCDRNQVNPCKDCLRGESMTESIRCDQKAQLLTGLAELPAKRVLRPWITSGRTEDWAGNALPRDAAANLEGPAVQWHDAGAFDFGCEAGWQIPAAVSPVEFSGGYFSSFLGATASMSKNLYNIPEWPRDPRQQRLVLLRSKAGLPAIGSRFLHPAERAAINQTLFNGPIERPLDSPYGSMSRAWTGGRRWIGTIYPACDMERSKPGEFQLPRQGAAEAEEELRIPTVGTIGVVRFGPVQVSVDQLGNCAVSRERFPLRHEFVVNLPRLFLVRMESVMPAIDLAVPASMRRFPVGFGQSWHDNSSCVNYTTWGDERETITSDREKLDLQVWIMQTLAMKRERDPACSPRMPRVETDWSEKQRKSSQDQLLERILFRERFDFMRSGMVLSETKR